MNEFAGRKMQSRLSHQSTKEKQPIIRLIMIGVALLLLMAYLLWPSEPEDPYTSVDVKKKVVSFLENGEFEFLDLYLQEIQRSFKAGKTREDILFAAYAPFQRVNRDLTKPLEDWVHTSPQSFTAHLALGVHYAGLGWAVRTERWGDEINDSMREGMRIHHNEAYRQLTAAVDLEPSAVPGHTELISILMALGDRPRLRNAVADALYVIPLSPAVYSHTIQAFSSKWGGEEEDIWSVIEQLDFDRFKPIRFTFTNIFYDTVRFIRSLRQNAKYQVARNAYFNNDYVTALAIIEELIDSSGDDYHPILQARILLALGKKWSAIEVLDRIIEIDPDHSDAHALKASILSYDGYHEAAEPHWQLALSIDPDDPDFLERYSSARIIAGDREAAIALLQRALLVGQNDHELRRSLGGELAFVGRIDESLEMLFSAFEYNPFDYEPWKYIVEVLLMEKDCRCYEYAIGYVFNCESRGLCTREETDHYLNMFYNSILADRCNWTAPKDIFDDFDARNQARHESPLEKAFRDVDAQSQASPAL